MVGIPLDTNCVPLVIDLFLFDYESDFIMSLSGEKEAEIVERSIQRLYFKITCYVSIIPNLSAWPIEFTHQNFGYIKRSLPIPRPRI